MQRESDRPFPPAPDGVAAGVVLVAGALLMLVAIVHHPVLHARRGAPAFAEIARFAATDALVHGVLIAVTFAFVFASTVLSLRRGLTDQIVVAALVAYAAGSSAIVAAGLIDGFVVPRAAAAYAGANGDALSAGIGALRLCGVAIQVATGFGFAANSAAIALWAIGLARGPALPLRAAGVIGLLAAVVPALVFLATGAVFTGPLLVWIILPEAVWYVLVGALLVRRIL